MNRFVTRGLLGTLVLFFCACSCESGRKASDEGARQHVVKCSKELYSGEYHQSEDFDVDTMFSDNGYYSIQVAAKPSRVACSKRLYAPDGKLLLIVGGCSESCNVCGYAIKYNDGGKVSRIWYANGLKDLNRDDYICLDDLSPDSLWQWYDALAAKDADFHFEYNKNGRLCDIKEIYSPICDTIEVSIEECPMFWTSDLDGGTLRFYALYKDLNHSGSSVDYLYADGKLAAELAYWKGTFIKTRTYNRYGQMVKVYDDRSIDVKEHVFYDDFENVRWYVDK